MKKEKLAALLAIALICIPACSTTIILVQATPLPQNDAGSGRDAADNTTQSVRVFGNQLYTGTLDPPAPAYDTQDYYNFTAYSGHWINVTMTPPSDADYDLWLLDPWGHTVNTSTTDGNGVMEDINYTATVNGLWFINVLYANGSPGNYTFFIQPLNFAPDTPTTPTGDNIAFVYSDYTCYTSTTDPDNDYVQYNFTWNDGTTSLTGWYASGASASRTHQYKRPTFDTNTVSYNITIQAIDYPGLSSDWSVAKSIQVNQSDAGSFRDAGATSASAIILPADSYDGKQYSSKGTLYDPNPTDRSDCYNYTVASGDRMYVTMTPPPTLNFDLELQDPVGNPYPANHTGPGNTETIDMCATMSGDWTIRVSMVNATGDGQYSFTLFVNGVTLTVGVSYSPPTGVTVWIDGLAYTASVAKPVTIMVGKSSHTIQAQDEFYIHIGYTGYVYIFDHWSDGVTDNPRTMDIQQNTTITTCYIRTRGPL